MKKRYFFIVFVLFFIRNQAQQSNFNLLIGTYTNSCDSKGIYVFDFNSQNGEFNLKSTAEKIINPSFLTVSSDNKFVYSVNENGSKSTISVYAFDSKWGLLQLLQQQDSKGADPCYAINDDRNVIVATYSGGSISVFGKGTDGGITPAKQVIQHKGKSVNIQRQESPHVHMVQFTPDKKYVLANDLGTDKIYVYKYDPNADTKILEIKDSINVKSGSGPRHLTFSAKGNFAYLLQELDGSLTVFSYKNGTLKKVQETKIIASDFKGQVGAADIHISEDDKFLYATNRGTANDISCYKIQKNGHLEFIERVATLGKGPRNFAIDPTGKFLLVAHQYSNDVIIFTIDKDSGKLTYSGKKIELCSPVCLVFTR